MKPEAEAAAAVEPGVAAKPEEGHQSGHPPTRSRKQTAREVFEHVIDQGRREYDVQRYKGLGEMTSTQLWETTMDPERRTLCSQVKLRRSLSRPSRSSAP